MTNEKKREKVDEFFKLLTDYVSEKAQDINNLNNSDCWDSCAGIGSINTEFKLKDALYELFDIEMEEDDD